MEYKQERFFLNKFCEFGNREVESDFMEYERASSLSIIRLLIILMGLTFAMFTLSDFYFHRGESSFPVLVALRGSALIITIVTFFLTRTIKRFEHTLNVVSATELAVFVIYLLNLSVQKVIDPSLQFMTVMLLILTVFLIPNRWKNCLFAGCVMLVVYIGFCTLLIPQMTTAVITQQGIYLGVCLMSCAVFIYGREKSERKHFAAEQLLEFMAITDRLTGIYNRGRFEFVLNTWIKNMRHDPFCLLLFDIDDFKKVNDTMGHNKGDRVLIETTKIVTSTIRDEDIFARWGGEEFVVLFGTVTLETVAELAERVRKAVEGNEISGVGKITISIGAAQYCREENITEFVNRADAKMYEAKKAGKNRVCVDTRTTKGE